MLLFIHNLGVSRDVFWMALTSSDFFDLFSSRRLDWSCFKDLSYIFMLSVMGSPEQRWLPRPWSLAGALCWKQLV